MNTSSKQLYIGIDLGDRRNVFHILNAYGECISKGKFLNTREQFISFSEQHSGAIIAIEVGTHSPWISRLLKELGHEVYIANPRKLRAIYSSNRKSDELDAQMLAKIVRLDPSLLYPIAHGSELAQQHLLQVKLRDNLVRQRVNIISSIRFSLKAMGIRLQSPKTTCFAKRARAALTKDHPNVLEMITPSLAVLDTISDQIKELEKAIQLMISKDHPEALKLMEITGVGPITALSFVLIVENPERFASSRDIGAYLGLVPKRDQSGNMDKELRISKAGDKYLRKLLVSAAQYIIGPFGKDCDLREKGLKLAERGGQRAKKKAVVAIARKLAVLMLSLLKSDQPYKAFHKA